ncbi:MAG: hypothetical protein K6G13_05485 [Agathobacter sp.]|uniref:hypothetical protein n=1 Tax=Agathobacter sp. TaxID=2021311 RepID=UPI002588C65A|nr:hypothetical protein [Agathobacter sp.]MCR5677466.1 hypothetical protein [Agathobacter sp.]
MKKVFALALSGATLLHTMCGTNRSEFADRFFYCVDRNSSIFGRAIASFLETEAV